MYVLQLKGDELRSCLSSNQLSSFVQCSSPFEIQIFLEYSCCFQRGIQGDSEQFSICVLKYFLISPFWFFISYSSEFSEISGICNPPLVPPLIMKCLFPIHDMQLKGDILRCGFSYNWRLTNCNFGKMTSQNIGTG